MIFKSKEKKKEISDLKRADEATNTIKQLVDNYQELEIFNVEKLGRAVDFNYPRTYIYMMCNYGEDISKLYENERYPSLYTIYYDFMKCYSLCKILLNTYFSGNEEEYENLLKKMFTLTLVQRKQECENYSDEYKLNHKEEVDFFKIRYNQMEGILKEYFSDYISRKSYNLDETDPETVYKIVDELEEIYKMKMSIDEITVDVITKNEYMTDEEKKLAIKTFVSGKSAQANNIQTVLTRIIGNLDGQRALILNKNEGVYSNILIGVEKSLQDVIEQVKEGFNL